VVALGSVALIYLLNLGNLLEFMRIRGGDYYVHLPSALPKLLAAATVGFNYFAVGETGLGRPLGTGVLLANLPLTALAIIPAGLALWGLIRLRFAMLTTRELVWSHCLFTFPVTMAMLASFVTHQYWLQPKYLIFVVPFALLLVAEGYLAVDPKNARRMAMATAAAVWLIAMLHFWNPVDWGRRENWREAARLLQHGMSPSSALVVLPGGGYSLLAYYWPEATKVWTDVAALNGQRLEAGFEQSLRNQVALRSDVYYPWYDIRRNIADPEDKVVKALDRIGTRIEVTTLNPRLRLYHWRLTP
jgi:hypothetical protein